MELRIGDLKIHLEDGDDKSLVLSRFLVLDKIVANRILNRRGALAILRGIWSLEVAPCIWEVGDMYGISYKSEDIMNKVIEEGSWAIMGNHLILKKWKKGTVAKKVDFSMIEFNIQVHNLPLELLTVKNVKVIGNRLGRFIRMDDEWVKKGIGRFF